MLATVHIQQIFLQALQYRIAKLGGIFAVYELLPAFIFATVVIIVVSLATGKPSQEVMDKFEEVKNMSK